MLHTGYLGLTYDLEHREERLVFTYFNKLYRINYWNRD